MTAVKSLHPGASEEAREEFLQEIKLMQKLRHPNIVCLLRTCTTTAPVLMVLEYLRTSLDAWLDLHGLHVGELDRLSVASQTAAGMDALASAEIIHRDLAARNVLLTGDPGRLDV